MLKSVFNDNNDSKKLNQNKWGKWTYEEDELLTQLVKNLGQSNPNMEAWKTISERIEGRDWQACKYRWEHHADPSVSRGDWEPAEDVKLIDLVNVFGKRWVYISNQFSNRN